MATSQNPMSPEPEGVFLGHVTPDGASDKPAGELSRIKLVAGESNSEHREQARPSPDSPSVALSKRLKDVMAGSRYLMDRDAGEVMAVTAPVIAEFLSPGDLERLREFGAGQGAPMVIVEGMPGLLELPPTPFRGFGDDTLVSAVDAQLLGIYGIMGTSPVAYTFENNGFIWRNVVPNPDEAGVASSHGFDATLDWHTDNPCGTFEPLVPVAGQKTLSPIPHYLGFASLRNRDGRGQPVATEVLPNDAILRRLDGETRAVLCADEFLVKPGASNRGKRPLEHVPLLVPYNGSYLFRFNNDPQLVSGLTDRAARHWRRIRPRLLRPRTTLSPSASSPARCWCSTTTGHSTGARGLAQAMT